MAGFDHVPDDIMSDIVLEDPNQQCHIDKCCYSQHDKTFRYSSEMDTNDFSNR